MRRPLQLRQLMARASPVSASAGGRIAATNGPTLTLRQPATDEMAVASQSTRPEYAQWNHAQLIERITALEQQLRALQTTHKSPSPVAAAVVDGAPAPAAKTRAFRPVDPAKYNTRFIALKFAYLGQNYNGLEHANGNVTPLPTVEEEMWKALVKCRLIFPPLAASYNPLVPVDRTKPFDIDWEGCEYSKCGRTDRGVSAFGQVIGIRVRSARPKPKARVVSEVELEDAGDTGGAPASMSDASQVEEHGSAEEAWDDIADELPYLQMLNNVLPDDIRMLAWCPHPPAGFDARFSCRERRYKYYFTQPAFSPTPGPLGLVRRSGGATAESGGEAPERREGYLDIAAMRQAAKYLEGEHDFRNFCKVDPSKQIKNHVRRIYYADIEKLDPATTPLAYLAQKHFRPGGCDGSESASKGGVDTVAKLSSSATDVYTFTVHGSAFLWHQVRQMVGILFLVGQGLESPELVRELLDVERMPRRPAYELASDTPLVLWDTIFPDESEGSTDRDSGSDSDSGSRADALDWVYAGDARTLQSRVGSAQSDGKFGQNSTVDKLWSVWRQRKMDEILAGSLLDLVVQQGDASSVERGGFRPGSRDMAVRHPKVWVGGNSGRVSGRYVPVMQKPRIDTPEEINARYAAKREKKMAARAAAAATANAAASGSGGEEHTTQG